VQQSIFHTYPALNAPKNTACFGQLKPVVMPPIILGKSENQLHIFLISLKELLLNKKRNYLK